MDIHKLLSCSIRSVKPPPFNLRKGGDCGLSGNQGSVSDVFNLSGSKSIEFHLFDSCTQLVELMHLKFENYIKDGHFLASRREFIEKGYEKISLRYEKCKGRLL